ncbi:hypothetical protein OLF92_11740, partial [Streptococcus pneumoniae]|nr:hypothetical protein [Streptococcus pneumoniae]
DLVAEGTHALDDTDPVAARLKEDLDVDAVIEAAVAFYEQPPTHDVTVETDWGTFVLTPNDWVEAFGVNTNVPQSVST